MSQVGAKIRDSESRAFRRKARKRMAANEAEGQPEAKRPCGLAWSPRLAALWERVLKRVKGDDTGA
eukprot:7946665-Karenia_brevis.AAC.1